MVFSQNHAMLSVGAQCIAPLQGSQPFGQGLPCPYRMLSHVNGFVGTTPVSSVFVALKSVSGNQGVVIYLHRNP